MDNKNGMQSQSTMMKKEITPSARECKVREGVYFTGEYLLWKVVQDNGIYAVKGLPGVDLSTGVYKGESKEFDSDWRSGFRVGVGYYLPYDGWDLYANYTWINNEHETRFSSTSSNIFEEFLNLPNNNAIVNTDSVEAEWHLKVNSGDLELAREYMISPKLSFRPYAGLKGSWITQHFEYESDAQLTNDPDRSKLKNDFWGVGPRLGMSSRWYLDSHLRFSVISNFSGSMLAGKFNVEQNTWSTTAATQPNGQEVEFDKARLVPQAQMQLGLSFSDCWDDWFQFDLFAAWETQVYWNQLRPVGVWESMNTAGDLMLYGLTAGLRLGF